MVLVMAGSRATMTNTRGLPVRWRRTVWVPVVTRVGRCTRMGSSEPAHVVDAGVGSDVVADDGAPERLLSIERRWRRGRGDRHRMPSEEGIECRLCQPTDRCERRPSEHDQRGGDRQDPSNAAMRSTLQARS
jgi:hypothetical protein